MLSLVWNVSVCFMWRLFVRFGEFQFFIYEGCLVWYVPVLFLKVFWYVPVWSLKVVWYVPVWFIWSLFGMFQFVLYEGCLVCFSLVYMKVVWYKFKVKKTNQMVSVSTGHHTNVKFVKPTFGKKIYHPLKYFFF